MVAARLTICEEAPADWLLVVHACVCLTCTAAGPLAVELPRDQSCLPGAGAYGLSGRAKACWQMENLVQQCAHRHRRSSSRSLLEPSAMSTARAGHSVQATHCVMWWPQVSTTQTSATNTSPGHDISGHCLCSYRAVCASLSLSRSSERDHRSAEFERGTDDCVNVSCTTPLDITKRTGARHRNTWVLLVPHQNL